jgi:hypothetical protein
LKDKRLGDWLWEEWDGDGHNTNNDNSIVYVTYDWVDLGEEIVRRALASCMQRDGVSDSLAHSFRMMEVSRVTTGFVGFIDNEKYPVVTDENGYTDYGELASDVSMVTWVECPE